VLWPGSIRVRAETASEIDPDGFYTRALQLPEHAGTHLDAPAHFDPSGRTTDEILPEALVAPCALRDGAELSFPGVAPSGRRAACRPRVAGIGVDTMSVDPGAAADFPVHQITRRGGLWHLEGLVNLAQFPARGALVVVGALPRVGSGAPGRVFALVPGAAG
jgi:kynurenine formamidase